MITQRNTIGGGEGSGGTGLLRVVRGTTAREVPYADAEFKAMLDDMKGRRRDGGRGFRDEGETPDAA